jgi:hypothetical protein
MSNTNTLPVLKAVVFGSEDTYRKSKMVEKLEARNLLSEASKRFILNNKR